MPRHFIIPKPKQKFTLAAMRPGALVRVPTQPLGKKLRKNHSTKSKKRSKVLTWCLLLLGLAEVLVAALDMLSPQPQKKQVHSWLALRLSHSLLRAKNAVATQTLLL